MDSWLRSHRTLILTCMRMYQAGVRCPPHRSRLPPCCSPGWPTGWPSVPRACVSSSLAAAISLQDGGRRSEEMFILYRLYRIDKSAVERRRNGWTRRCRSSDDCRLVPPVLERVVAGDQPPPSLPCGADDHNTCPNRRDDDDAGPVTTRRSACRIYYGDPDYCSRLSGGIARWITTGLSLPDGLGPSMFNDAVSQAAKMTSVALLLCPRFGLTLPEYGQCRS